MTDGLILNLRKRRIGIRTDMNNKDGFLLFGYYDYLNIQRTNEWFDFSPVEKDATAGSEERQKGAAAERELFSDAYPVKLLFPREDCQKNMGDMGFCFEPWYNSGKFCGRSPLISIVLLNVSNRFLAQYGTPAECLKAVARGIKKAAMTSGGFLSGGAFSEDKFKKLNCGLFQAIGSQDYVLLCLSDNWHDVFLLVDALHAWKASPKEGEPYSAISNLYLVPGISAAGIDAQAMDTAEDDKMLEAVVRLTLRSGESVQGFYRDFDKKLKEYFKDRSCEAEFSMLHGRYDAAVTFTAPVLKALSLLQNGGILHPSNEFFKKHLVDTNLSIRLKIGGNGTDGGEKDAPGPKDGTQESADENKFSKQIEAIEVWADETYEGFLKKTFQHTRQAKALRELLILLSNLSKSPHSNAVCSILLDALESLQKNVDLLMQQYGDGSGKESQKYLNDINRGTDRFRDLVGNYLLSLAQAERLFIEGLRIRHQSIASATKLLFSYNRIIRTLAEITSRGREYSYSFVVVSGGCDSTKAYNLFDYPVEKSGDTGMCENRLVVIQLSEMSIFNVPGTLFRLFHEAWHYCGDRLRPQRNNAWLESLSFALSYVLAAATFLDPKPFTRLRKDCAAIGLNELASSLNELFESEKNRYACAIAQSFQEFLKRNAPHLAECSPDGAEIYRERYWTAMQATLFEWLCPDLGWGAEQGEGNKAVLAHLVDHQAELLREMLALAEKERSKPGTGEKAQFLNTVPIETLKGFVDAVREKGETVEKTKHFVNLCTALLCQYRVRWEDFNEYLGDDEENLSKQIAHLRDNHIFFLRKFISTAYKEAFSDYMACHTLCASATDYLLGLVYESWSLDKSFAIQHLPVLRIGSVLEALCCDGRKDRSFDQIWDAKEFKEKFDRLAKTSPRYRKSLSVDAFEQRVRLIWDHYNIPLMQGISRPLVDYLKLCSAAMDERIRQSGKQEELNRIRATFEKANAILSDNQKLVADGVNDILCYWIDLNCETDWGGGAEE